MLATLTELSIAAVEQRLGPPHQRQPDEKSTVSWAFRCDDYCWEIYDRIGDPELHIGGNQPASVWFALMTLGVPHALTWRPVDVPAHWTPHLIIAADLVRVLRP